ncbi:FMN-dependent NADH-azoreductase [Planobispora rosea]|uniref:FMN dependent NADH:quinone oxidoreductase n=1 Tax=Planobispora rosea TaxID=35762 RepID=A0A8J3S195_PLARO|nr:NAD(P)H-dependent oxidoreductase [Planobispora rosea]GGS70178.1 FMN-dependent NADH-azoreductase [Planobispora rosea]GIH83229.1 FMN-dependent NADH-azoreductase [Planobispora rosea]
MRLLHISASPRGSASESLTIAGEFLDAYRRANPGAEIDHFDLWDGTLPAFGPEAVAAKMAVFGGAAPEGEAWAAAVRTFERFNAHDRYLFSVPMWNSGVPYVLKQFIDVVSQPGMVFGFDPETGYIPLLKGKKAAVVYTSAVWAPGLPPGFGDDFQAPFFDGWLRWAGITDITGIGYHPTVTGDADLERKRALTRAREVAAAF